MKKAEQERTESDEMDMLPEYTFTGKKGVRGKYCRAYRQGQAVWVLKEDGTTDVQYFTLEEGAVMLEPDIREYFPDSQAVNAALRGLIKLAPQRKACLRHPKTRASGWHQRLSSSSPYDPDRKQDGASAAGCRLAQRLLAVGS